jgi:hypothetical protein
MDAAASLSDFSYPFAPQNPSEFIDPKSNDPTPLSSPLQSDGSNLSDFSYPFAPPPMSIDGRPLERLYSGSWTDSSPLETDVATAWNLSFGKENPRKTDYFGNPVFAPPSPSMNLDANRHHSERFFSASIPVSGDYGTPHRRGSMSHRSSNLPFIPQSPAKQSLSRHSDRDRDRDGSAAPLPSFFFTSLSNPVKHETLEKEDEEEENVDLRVPFEMDPHSDALPVINTGPIEDDDEEEDEQQVGMSPLLYPLGAPVSPWQNSPWKTPPLQSMAPPPGFVAPPSSYYTTKLSGSEGNQAHRVVSGGMGNPYAAGVGNPLRSPQVQIRWETKDVKVWWKLFYFFCKWIDF